MPTDDKTEDQTLNDLMASDEAFAEQFYRAPREVISRVAGAVRKQVHEDYATHRQQEDALAAQERNWQTFFANNTQFSRADHDEVKRFIRDAVNGGDPELTGYTGRVEDAHELMANRAERHLKELAKQRIEDEELSVYSGGPGSENEADPEALRTDPEASLTKMIKSRQAQRRNWGRGSAS